MLLVVAITAGTWHVTREPARPDAIVTRGHLPGSAAATPHAQGPSDASPPQRFRRIDRDARTTLLQQIQAARIGRMSGSRPTAAPSMSPALPQPLAGELTADELMADVFEVMPLMKECYLQGLDRRTIKNGQVRFGIRLIVSPRSEA